MKIVCFNPPKFIKKFLRLFKSSKQKCEKVETKEKEINNNISKIKTRRETGVFFVY